MAIFLFVVFLLFLFPVGNDGDFFHHVNTGKYIWENTSLPYFDEWTFTAKNHAWISYSWASGLLFYLIFSNFGLIGISIFSAAVALFSFTIGYFLLLSYNVSKIISYISLLAIFPLVQTRWPARPEIISYPFLLLILLFDRLSITRPILKWTFPLLIFLWANFYGANVLVGIFLISIIGIREIFRKRTFTLTVILPLSVLASLLNGYGFDTLFYFFKLRSIAPFQLEWSSLTGILFKSPTSYLIVYQYKIIIYSLFSLLLILLTIYSYKKSKANIFPLLLSLSIFLPILAFRHLPISAFLSLPLLGILLEKTKRIPFFIITTILISVISTVITVWINKSLQDLNQQPFSPSLVEFIKANGLEGKSINNQNLGAYLTYRLYPKIEVAIDTRDDLFLKTNVLSDFLKPDAKLPEILEKYTPDLIIADYTTSPLSYQEVFSSPGFTVVFFDDGYFIAVKTNIAIEKKLPQLKGIDPYTDDGLIPGQLDQGLKTYLNAYLSNPNSYNNQLFYSLANLSAGNADQSISSALSILLTNTPQDQLLQIPVLNILSESYLLKRDCQKSFDYFKKAYSLKQQLLFKIPQSFFRKTDQIKDNYNRVCR